MSAEMNGRSTVAGVREESLHMCTDGPKSSFSRGESGFALILALLALLLLTFLGLTLAVTTSTELQIATNYRWSEQARYAAEAGVEVAKVRLRGVTNWVSILPPARTTSWVGNATPGAPPAPRVVGGVTLRDYENANCDLKGNGVGNGLVLSTGSEPQQYVSTFNTLQLTGAFTVWVRRPLWIMPTGQFSDWGQEIIGPPHFDASDDNLIMVVEGVAPFTGAGAYAATGSTGAMVARSKAVYTIEMPFSHAASADLGTCQTSRTGQTGHGSQNSGFGGCESLRPDALASARMGSTSTGSGAANAAVR
jgi:hypothetical protein